MAAFAVAQTPPARPPAPAKAAVVKSATEDPKNFFIHAFHKEKLNGELECSLCHVPAKEGSVMLKRPGHDQCMTCHDADFNQNIKQVLCAQCHTTFPPAGAADLVPFPRYKSTRTILFEFSHAAHVDPKARIDAKTGFRADCTTCHKFQANGVFGTFPTHQECATCHSKPGYKPQLTTAMTGDTCRGCHTPEEIENPGFTESRRLVSKSTASGKYEDIKFSHIAHFKVKDEYNIKCTTCHYEIPRSTGLSTLTLPKMLDCVQCHDATKTIPAQFKMQNCSTCHNDPELPGKAPASHTVNVKPEFHTEVFRQHHEAEASAPDAKCFVCHQNVSPSIVARSQCDSCHAVMRPQSHTVRFKDDVHGKIAALDRTVCATCHRAEYCSACHNELPRSHVPLPLFKAGAHAVPAMLDQRACMTCHTFQNTCAECHTNKIAFNLPVAAPAKAEPLAASKHTPPAAWLPDGWRTQLLLFR